MSLVDLNRRRVDYNDLILRELSDYMLQHPQMRFTQALFAMGGITLANFEESYYEEPWDIYKRIQKFKNKEKA